MSIVGDTTSLPQEIVNAIQRYIDNKFNHSQLHNEFPNRLLREDTLALLDKYCTVVYYPLENEENNGFHITGIPYKGDDERDFVFINTAQTIEKQVFTAAHELGHIWKVDEYVAENCNLAGKEDVSSEQIINRFAAELLIPTDIFKKSFELEYKKYQNEDGKITVANMLKVIVALMNQFFVPVKAIVYRCVELGLLSEETAPVLLGTGGIPLQVIDNKIQEIIRDNGYIQFQEPNNKRWIMGLAELLDQAEKMGTVSTSKIQKLREIFAIPQETADYDQMNETLG